MWLFFRMLFWGVLKIWTKESFEQKNRREFNIESMKLLPPPEILFYTLHKNQLTVDYEWLSSSIQHWVFWKDTYEDGYRCSDSSDLCVLLHYFLDASLTMRRRGGSVALIWAAAEWEDSHNAHKTTKIKKYSRVESEHYIFSSVQAFRTLK